MCKVGDKFVIEIGGEYPENPFEDGENGKAPTMLYKIKGFNSLVFDKNGLDKLEKYDNDATRKYAAVGAYFLDLLKRPLDFVDSKEKVEKILSNIKDVNYEKGLSDAWEAAKKICSNLADGGIDIETIKEIFGETPYAVMKRNTPQEAIDKLKTWEEKQEIKVGDVIISSEGNKAVIQFITPNGEWECFNKYTYFTLNKEKQKLWKRTGKHIDLTEIFKGLEVENAD